MDKNFIIFYILLTSWFTISVVCSLILLNNYIYHNFDKISLCDVNYPLKDIKHSISLSKLPKIPPKASA